MGRRANIDWDKEPLGVETDGRIAARLGVSGTAVTLARNKRGIPRSPKGEQSYDWTKARIALLGTADDRVIAKRLKLNVLTVQKKRRELGINPWRDSKRRTCRAEFGSEYFQAIDARRQPRESRSACIARLVKEVLANGATK